MDIDNLPQYHSDNSQEEDDEGMDLELLNNFNKSEFRNEVPSTPMITKDFCMPFIF